MLTTWALALIAAGGFLFVRYGSKAGFVIALAGAAIIPLPSWWIEAIHFVAH